MNSISADGAAFQGTAITSITLPATITSISTCAFINCTQLQKVTLPETLTSIEWGAFAYCSSLTEINLPNSLISLSAWAFAGCRELKQITIPQQITTLPSACFKESGLIHIDIPENIVSLQNLCLNTSSLSYVKIYQSDINNIWTSDNAFGTYDNIQNTDLFVPRGSVLFYSQYYPWAKFRSIDEFGFVVNIENNDGGKITASKTVVLNKDEDIRLTISPNTGYILESLSINGLDVTNNIVNGEYIISDIKEDINVVGVFKINKYKLTYTVDGKEYKSSEVEYGATITPETEPEKEGYTFSGWSEIPETMPAHDVVITGTFERYFDVGHLVKAINLIMNSDASASDMSLFDLNNDEELNIGDIILIVKNILNHNSSNSPAAIGRRAGEVIDLTQYTAAQFEVKMADGKDIRLVSSMAQTHQLMCQKKDANTYSVVVFSRSNELMSPENGSIIEMDGVEGSIENVVLAKPTGETDCYQSLSVSTGIQQIENGISSAFIYDLKGNRLNGAKALDKGIYIVNGKKILTR